MRQGGWLEAPTGLQAIAEMDGSQPLKFDASQLVIRRLRGPIGQRGSDPGPVGTDGMGVRPLAVCWAATCRFAPLQIRQVPAAPPLRDSAPSHVWSYQAIRDWRANLLQLGGEMLGKLAKETFVAGPPEMVVG